MKDKMDRTLELIDLYFIGLGGQAPILSILTFATAVMLYSFAFAPIAILIGTLIVLFNGYVVYLLSSRFSEPGGYYTYAFSSLTERLGFETGWMYVFYAVLYGSSYLVGGSFLISYIFKIPILIPLLLIFALATVFLLLGIKPSAKYAIFAASIELVFLFAIGILGIGKAGFRIYNPLSSTPSLKDLALAILFAIGIPTGFGTVTPLSGEAKKPKHVGMAVIGVIVVGGALAAFAVYGLFDSMMFLHQTSLLETKFPALYLISGMLGKFGVPILLLVVFNDTLLGVLAFMTATSRTIFAMSLKGHLHASLSKLRKGNPINASIVSALAYLFIGSLAFMPISAFYLFMDFAIISGLSGLFIHLAADTSLLRLRFGERAMYVSIMAALFSFVQLVFGIISANSFLVYLFFIWIIVGFFYLEALDFLSRRKEERKRKGQG